MSSATGDAPPPERPLVTRTEEEEDDDRELRELGGAELIHLAAQMHAGPLPPPRQLGEYDDVLPGLADRIVQMAEKQSGHRQSLERQAQTRQLDRLDRGMMFGFGVAIFGLVCGTAVAILKSPTAGAAIAGVDLAVLVGIFVYGQRTSFKREKKTLALEDSQSEE